MVPVRADPIRDAGNDTFTAVVEDTGANVDSAPADVPVDTAPPFLVASIAAGTDTTCAVGVDRSVRCWGNEAVGLEPEPRSIPVVVPHLTAIDVVTSNGLTCVRDKSGVTSCWTHWAASKRFFGVDVGTKPEPVALLAGMLQVAIAAPRSCARNKDGAVFCADAHAISTDVEKFRVPGLTAAELAVGAGFACARDPEGFVRCWGANDKGQLGSGDTETSSAPAKLSGLEDVLQISAGVDHACVKKSAEVLCWGGNKNGQLGDGSRINRTRPTKVAGLGAVVAVVLGDEHSCARKGDGTVWCWGDNTHGQLGDGTTTSHAQPTLVSGLTDAVELALGGVHSCARKRDRTMWCWGANKSGTLGDGTTADRSVPTRVSF